MKNSSLGGKPTKPVVNVLPPGESTVTVQWTQPSFSTTCDVAFGEDKNNLPKVGISSSVLWNIPKADLVPEKDYYIKVRGFNSLQDGDWSDLALIRLPKVPVSQPAPQPVPAPVALPVTRAVAQPQGLDSERLHHQLPSSFSGYAWLISDVVVHATSGNILPAKSLEPTTVNYYFTAPKAPEIEDVWIVNVADQPQPIQQQAEAPKNVWIVNTVIQPQPIQQQIEARIEPPRPPEEMMVMEPQNPYYNNYDYGYSCGYPYAYSCGYSRYRYSRQPWVKFVIRHSQFGGHNGGNRRH